MIVGQEIRWTEIPHEPGNFLGLTSVSWGALKEAQNIKRREAVASMRDMGADIIQALPTPTQADKMIAAALEDPLDTYAQSKLIEEGVRGWRGAGYDGHEFDASLLDSVTAEWAAREVYAMSRIEGDEAGKSRASYGATTAREAARDIPTE